MMNGWDMHRSSVTEIGTIKKVSAGGLRSAVGGLAIVLLTTACDRAAPENKSSSQRAYASVSVSQASRKAIAEQIIALGSVAAWQELTLSSQTGGVAVIEVTVTENDRVKQGDLLVRLDDRVLKAQIAEQRATIAEAQANVESAQNKAARANVLAATQAMSKEDVEERRMAIKTSQAKLEQTQAVLEQLERQWEQTRIVAPADGYVSQKPAVIGTIVQVGTELVRLIRDGRLEVEAKVPDKDLGFIRENQVAHVRIPGGPAIEARVRAIAAKVDSKTRLGVVYVSLPAQTKFRPGMFANVSIDAGVREALTIPEEAVVWRENEAAVFVIDGAARVTLTGIVTGARKSGMVVVERGLKDNDRVVSTGAGFLNDGDSVRAVLAEATTVGALP
jgi:RND family efflux transporter MFP subunit